MRLRALSLIGLASAVAGCADQSSEPAGPSAPAFSVTGPAQDLTNRWIVVFRDETARPDALTTALAAGAGAAVHFRYSAALKGFAATIPPAALEGLRRDPDVCFVEEGRGATPEPYEESDYYQVVDIRPDLSGEFVLPANRPRGDFIRGVVGANKELHQKASHFTSPLKAIRFLYLKDVDGDCLPAVGPEYRVQINNLRVQDHEKDIWTINRVRVFADGFRSSFRICYSASKE
jgi:hypothetical protein